MPRCPLCLSQAGTALPGDLESIGEMLVVKGRAYTKCTGQAQRCPPSVIRWWCGPRCRMPCVLFVSSGSDPALPLPLHAEFFWCFASLVVVGGGTQDIFLSGTAPQGPPLGQTDQSGVERGQ